MTDCGDLNRSELLYKFYTEIILPQFNYLRESIWY